MGSKPEGQQIPGSNNSLSVIYQNDQPLSGPVDLLSKQQGDCLERHIWGPTQEPSPGRWTPKQDPWAVLENQPCSKKTLTFQLPPLALSCFNPPSESSVPNLVGSSQPITPFWLVLDFLPNSPFQVSLMLLFIPLKWIPQTDTQVL